MRAEYLNAADKWHRAYHGTREDSVLPILKTGDLLQPGDVTPTGDQLGERPGHLEEDNQIGLDTKQVFVTPSVKYAAREEYATPSKFHDKEDASVHKAQVAFQVYIQPDTYERGPETVGLKTKLDPEFNNQELEWSTKRRGVILLAGVLVKLELLKKGKANKKGFGPKKSKS
ncbi:neuralized-like protein 4 [Ptychodera flava]|uniref:neuralized-like protein 4 n=1 Tax=Ptychodera flava TaxID=63121 RepID=UPI00396A3C82